MRSRTPRKFASEEELYAYALRSLMRRAYSFRDLRQALERRSEDNTHVQQVMARLVDHKYLDDARYAVQFARAHAVNRKQGRFRITRELRNHGVSDRHIESALQEVFATTDEGGLVRKRIQRKLKSLRGPLDERKRASLYGSLLRAGFSSDIIRRELRAVTKGDVSDLPDVSDTLED